MHDKQHPYLFCACIQPLLLLLLLLLLLHQRVREAERHSSGGCAIDGNPSI